MQTLHTLHPFDFGVDLTMGLEKKKKKKTDPIHLNWCIRWVRLMIFDPQQSSGLELAKKIVRYFGPDLNLT